MERWHEHGPGKMRFIGLACLGLVGAVFFGFLFGYFVMLLWNWLMPAIFGLAAVSYWQAAGLVILARLLFGSGGHGHHGHPGHHGHHGFHGHHEGECGGEGHHYFHHGRDWRHYGEWWKSEGRQAFEGYVNRVKSEEQPKSGE